MEEIDINKPFELKYIDLLSFRSFEIILKILRGMGGRRHCDTQDYLCGAYVTQFMCLREDNRDLCL